MIDLNPNHLKTVKRILAEHVPGCEVRAFGSRATWTAKDYSDLHLAVVGNGPLDWGVLGRLKEALEESELPMQVDVLDWHSTSEGSKEVIERDYVVVQAGAEERSTVAADGWKETDYGTFRHDFQVDSLCNLCNDENGIQTGPFGSQLHREDYVPVGTPIITVEHLGENRIIHTDLPHVSDYDRNRLAKYTLRQGDIVFSRVGSVDRRSLVREAEEGWLFSGRCLRVRPDINKIDPAYLSYLFGLHAFQEHIRSIAVGATMPSLNTQILSRVSIVYPPLPEQRAIAHVLGTLDDKIELNRRMNETLEAMARALFKSWFVDFDPVRAKMDGRWQRGESLPGLLAEHYDLFPDRLADSELGEIPEGWEIRPLGDFIEISSGGTPRTSVSDYWDGDIPWYTAKDAPGLSDVFVLATERSITQAGVDNSSTKVLPVGTTIITARGTVGRLACLGIPMAMNQTCYGIRGVEGYPDFFTYWNVRNTVSELQARTHGTIFDTITRETFRIAEAVQAATEVPRAFEYAVSPLMSRILSNLNESRTLTAQRDALLPKLLAGAVRVESTQTQGAARPEIESSRDMAGDDRRKVLY